MAIIQAIMIGFLVGVIFALFKLPIPAPTVLSGVMGIFGIYLGGLLVNNFIDIWNKLF